MAEHYFFDTSALIKRYIAEQGSNWVQNICDPIAGNQIFVSRLTFVELHSALAKSYRMRLLDQHQLVQLSGLVARDTHQQYQQISMHQSIYQLAARLTLTYVNQGLRAYDAMQLAAALYQNRHLARSREIPLASSDGDESAVARRRHEVRNR